MENNHAVQGNDPRMNSEKPLDTYQIYNVETKMLSVFCGDNEESGLYFHGKPEHYMGGATRQESLEDTFVGDLTLGMVKEWSTGVEDKVE